MTARKKASGIWIMMPTPSPVAVSAPSAPSVLKVAQRFDAEFYEACDWLCLQYCTPIRTRKRHVRILGCTTPAVGYVKVLGYAKVGSQTWDSLDDRCG